jgi:hypothetical protein
MSNGTRKKVVDFKKLLVNEEDSMLLRKKGSKLNYSNQNNSHKKDKNSKNFQKQRENQSKASEKPPTKKQKTKNCQKKEQISLVEFTNKLNDFQEELAFLNKKRNADLNVEKILSFQNNKLNKINSALNNNDNKNKNNSKNKKTENIKDINSNTINNNKNITNIEINKNNTKTEINNENSTLIIDFYKLYYHLFESNRLDNSKPYKFVDYLITGDNLLFNLKKDKSRFEEIKKGMSLKTKNNSLISEQLLNKYIYEYLRCDFSNSFMKKLTEKVNVFLMNRYINKKKERNSLENSISIEKKDKFTYSNFLADKLKDNNINKSCLSFTNDTEYFKSLIYVCNKYSKYIGKKEIPEKILIESLEKNKKILDNFKNSEEDGGNAKKIENGYLNDLLHNKSIRKYISKKLKSLNGEIIEHNQILKSLDINIFYKILSTLIKNKNDDDIDKLYKLFEEDILINDNEKLDKNDLKNFIILFKFLLELELTNNLNNNDITNDLNENNINHISLVKEIYENINNQLNSRQKTNESENSLSNSTKKNKVRRKIKPRKNLKKIQSTDNDSSKMDIVENNNSEDNANNNNTINILNNQNQNNINISNLSDTNNNINTNNTNTINVKTKKRTKNSKIIPFKIPYPINNTNSNNNNIISSTNNKANNSLFEINNTNDLSSNNNNNPNPINKIDEQNKNNLAEKTHFEIYNESQNENNENIKEKTRAKKGRKKNNTEENKESNNNSSVNDIPDNKKKDYIDNNNILPNSFITFYSTNQNNAKKELNIGKYLLDRLSTGQDIFKLIIEKPKIKRSKEKEVSENNSIDKENENDKEENIDTNKDTNDKDNKDKDIKENNKKESNKRNRRIKKEKIKEENTKIKEEESNAKIKEEEEKEIKIKNEDMRTKKEKDDEDIIIRNDKNEENKSKEEKEKDIIDNKINNTKKEVETREDSSKSTDKIDKINSSSTKIKNINLHNNNIFFTKNEKNRNIDIIQFNNGMIQEGGTFKEITRNDLKHSPNISVKISQKTIKIPSYKTIDIETKDSKRKNSEIIFNINNFNTKNIFATNKNNYNNLETKSKIKKSRSDISKKDSFKNLNIQIDRQSVEIKGGNVILNDKRDNQSEECIKIKDYFSAI